MKIFLLVLLGLFIALIIAILVLRLVLRKVVSKVAEVIKQAANEMPPPFRLKLVPVENPEWLAESAVKQRMDALKASGFEMVGAFDMEGTFDTCTVGFVHPEAKMLGAVNWVKGVAGVDLVTCYEDGTTLTYGDLAQGSELARSPANKIVRIPHLGAADLHQRMLAERRQDSIIPVTAAEFIARYEKSYNDSMDWLAERGGYTLAELRAEASKSDPQADPQTLEDIHQKFAANALTNWLSTQAGRPEPWDEQASEILVVHDDLTMRQVTNLFNETQDEEAAFQEAEVAKAGARPREAFANINSKLGGKFIKVGEKTSARAADFYVLAPEAAEEAAAA